MLLITCPFGLTSLLTTELKRLGMKPFNVFTTGCRIDSDRPEDIITINLQSRIANKVYRQLATGSTKTFEDLFQLTKTVDRHRFLPPTVPFTVRVVSTNSTLHAERSVQSIVHKAVITTLTGDADAHRPIDDMAQSQEIFVIIEHDEARLFINTSGPGLHERGRRTEAGDAPLKENLAAATLLIASRPFHQPLRDPCCGSGTLIIEAALLAQNTPPGHQRGFAFQDFSEFSPELLQHTKNTLMAKRITKPRTFIASDIDPDVLAKAKRNAERAGVADLITFVEHDMLSKTLPAGLTAEKPVTIVCNPPYEKRLRTETVADVHLRLASLIQLPGRNGAIITGYDDAAHYFSPDQRKRKETRQGKEKCYIWSVKG